jgi:hypothetical protein
MTPDLAARQSEADGTLNKFAVKADGSAEGAYLYELQVAFPVNNSAEAETLGAFIPGAKDTYLRATERDDWKSSVTVVPDLDGVHVELADARSGRSIIKGVAEIKAATYRTSKRAAALVLKVLLGGQTEAIAAVLTKALRAPVHFIFEQSQQSLFGKEKGQAKPVPEMGNVVCALENGERVWGRVVEVNDGDEDDDAKSIVLDDFGVDHVVTSEDVQSFWQLAETDDLDKLLKSYKDRAKRRELTPTWSALTVAVGEAFGAGGAPGEGAHALTKEIVERAVAVLADGGAGVDVTRTGTGGGLAPNPGLA